MADSSQNTEDTMGQPGDPSYNSDKPFVPKPGTATYTREPAEKSDRLEMDLELVEDDTKGNIAWIVLGNLTFSLGDCVM